MSQRLKAFHSLAAHPWMGRLYSKLSKSDLATCERFIADHESLSDLDFMAKVLRWGVDVKVPSKNYPLMNELLLVTGTVAQIQRAKGAKEKRDE